MIGLEEGHPRNSSQRPLSSVDHSATSECEGPNKVPNEQRDYSSGGGEKHRDPNLDTLSVNSDNPPSGDPKSDNGLKGGAPTTFSPRAVHTSSTRAKEIESAKKKKNNTSLPSSLGGNVTTNWCSF